MAELTVVHGNIGKMKHLEASEGKAAVTYASVAENKYKHVGEDENGKNVYEETDPVWHELRIEGADAVRFNKLFEVGDPVIAYGNTLTRERVLEDGRKVEDTTVFVKGFGPESTRANHIEINRKQPKAAKEEGLAATPEPGYAGDYVAPQTAPAAATADVPAQAMA